MKMQPIGHQYGIIAVERIDIDAHEDVHTVSAVHLYIRHPAQVRLSVYVHLKSLAVVEGHAAYQKCRFIAVIDHQLHRSAALLREDGVERKRVARKRQTQRRIIAGVVFFATGQTKEYGAKSKD